MNAAKGVASSLNDATRTVQSVRADADADMATSVTTINQLLAQFETVNTAIVKGTITGADTTDYLDLRDSILSRLSQEVGITVATRANNDMVIYTDSGVTLFETSARSVTFDQTYAFTAGIDGNAVYIDGVPVIGASAVMPIHGGKTRWPCRAARRRLGLVSEPARRDRARIDRDLRGERSNRRGAARCSRSFHLPGRSGNTGVGADFRRSRRHDHRRLVGRSERWRQSEPAQRRRDLR